MDLKSHVSEAWVRDIRKWLEAQPGATEFDGSPLDGVQRVMQYKDTRIVELEQQLADVLTVPVHVIFDGPPSHESGRFVEVETPEGKSVRLGKWINRGDGYWALVFNVTIDQTTGYESANEGLES